MSGTIQPLLQYALMAWCSVDAQGQLYRIQARSGAHPASYPEGKRGSFTRGKAAGIRSWQITYIQSRGKKAWCYTSTPPYLVMAWCLVKDRVHFHRVSQGHLTAWSTGWCWVAATRIINDAVQLQGLSATKRRDGKRIGEEVIVAYFIVLLWFSPGQTDEKHENLRESRCSVFFRSKSITKCTTLTIINTGWEATPGYGGKTH